MKRYILIQARHGFIHRAGELPNAQVGSSHNHWIEAVSYIDDDGDTIVNRDTGETWEVSDVAIRAVIKMFKSYLEIGDISHYWEYEMS